MDFETKYITPDIKLSCYEGPPFKTDAMFDEHLLVWHISGETKIIMADDTRILGAGDIFLIPRHQLATVINYRTNELPHKAVAIHLTPARLQKFYEGVARSPAPSTSPGIRRYREHPLLESFLASLIPYFEMETPFPENIASLKITEAISILREIDPGIDSVLTDFERPGKLSISSFMEKNYMFNMPLEKFGYLTGRSLSSFNRDFRHYYHTTPQKWLTQKRLELAHQQIVNQHKKPNEVYLEVGFENLSHFSFAFKKQYGYAPTQLSNTN